MGLHLLFSTNDHFVQVALLQTCLQSPPGEASCANVLALPNVVDISQVRAAAVQLLFQMAAWLQHAATLSSTCDTPFQWRKRIEQESRIHLGLPLVL